MLSFIFNPQERGTATEPPPRAVFSGNVTQWEINDAYQEDFEKQVCSFPLPPNNQGPYSPTFSPRFCKFECNTISGLLNHMV